MRANMLAVLLCAAVSPVALFAADNHPLSDSPSVFIEPQGGFESYISAAIIKKHVPVVVTTNKGEAVFLLTSAVLEKPESGAAKVARCLFMYCAGIAGTQTATVSLVNNKTQQVVWAYNVHKGAATAYQSTSEAIAKHMKDYLEKQK